MFLILGVVFYVGREWGSLDCHEASNGFVAVLRGYLHLHVWHHREALIMTNIAHFFQIPLTFTTEQEVQALRAVVGTVATACLWRVFPGARGSLLGLPAIAQHWDETSPAKRLHPSPGTLERVCAWCGGPASLPCGGCGVLVCNGCAAWCGICAGRLCRATYTACRRDHGLQSQRCGVPGGGGRLLLPA